MHSLPSFPEVHQETSPNPSPRDLQQARKDVRTLAKLLESRERETALLHAENSGLREEISDLRLNSSRLQKIVSTLTKNSARWENLAREISDQASENFQTSKSLRSDLEISQKQISDLREFLAATAHHAKIENFRSFPNSPAALRGLRDLRARLKKLQSEISSDFPGERVTCMHAEFSDIMDSSRNLHAQSATVARPDKKEFKI